MVTLHVLSPRVRGRNDNTTYRSSFGRCYAQGGGRVVHLPNDVADGFLIACKEEN